MPHTTKHHRSSILVHALDLALLLIVLTIATAGVSWLTTRSEAAMENQRRPPMPKDEMQRRIAEYAARDRELHSRRDRAKTDAAELQEQCGGRPAGCRPDIGAIEERRDRCATIAGVPDRRIESPLGRRARPRQRIQAIAARPAARGGRVPEAGGRTA